MTEFTFRDNNNNWGLIEGPILTLKIKFIYIQ